MLRCGVKLTHDGGVALLDDERLVFSIEMENLEGNLRYSRISDFGVVGELLEAHGYELTQVDRLLVDGWRKTSKPRLWNDQEVLFELAPYRCGLVDRRLFAPYERRVLDQPYTSYTHYAGHVASSYLSSPFTSDPRGAYVLCWDGRMMPFLYHLGPEGCRDLGPLSYLLGDVYRSLCQLFPPFGPPFDGPVEAQVALALPGKIMAYTAMGKRQEQLVELLQESYEQAVLRTSGDVFTTVLESRAHERLGNEVCRLMSATLAGASADLQPEDAIASVHHWMGELLVEALVDAVRRDGSRTPNLCLAGGCALNIKWNRAIRETGRFEDVWVPPFPNDAGSAIGVACADLYAQRPASRLDWDVYAGPALLPPRTLPGWSSRPCSPVELAGVLHESGEPVLFLSGRAELGPRALGHRSILAAASDARMKDELNRVKGREDYRPVAPICLADRAPEVFDPGSEDPFMLFDHDVRAPWQDRVPAIVHLDGTARVQTIRRDADEDVARVLVEYERRSGLPLLCNTSANASGRGFFTGAAAAMEWGRVRRVWSEGELFEAM